MADDKTTKTPEQPVTDTGSGKETLILCQEKVQIKNDFFPSCQHT